MTMLTLSVLLMCVMISLTTADSVELRVYSKSSSCPCGWTEYQDRCFIYVSKALKWSEAQENCQSMKANLASVRSYSEYSTIRSLTAASGYRNAWIGGSDAQQERYWFWIDGTPFTYSKWCVGQPSHKGDGPYCLQINYGAGRCWDDAECKARFPSVCARKVQA